jgi:hypothetical protein
VTRFVWIARKQRLDYAGFLYVCQQALRKLGLRKSSDQSSFKRAGPQRGP